MKLEAADVAWVTAVATEVTDVIIDFNLVALSISSNSFLASSEPVFNCSTFLIKSFKFSPYSSAYSLSKAIALSRLEKAPLLPSLRA